MRTNGGLSKSDLGNRAGVDHLLYFCAKHSRTAIPSNEERAPEERKKDKMGELKGVKHESCQRANEWEDTNGKDTEMRLEMRPRE